MQESEREQLPLLCWVRLGFGVVSKKTLDYIADSYLWLASKAESDAMEMLIIESNQSIS